MAQRGGSVTRSAIAVAGAIAAMAAISGCGSGAIASRPLDISQESPNPPGSPRWPVLTEIPAGIRLVAAERREVPDCPPMADCPPGRLLATRSLRYGSEGNSPTSLSLEEVEIGTFYPARPFPDPPWQVRRADTLPIGAVVEATWRTPLVAITINSVGFDAVDLERLITNSALLDDQAWDRLATTAAPALCTALRLAPAALPAGLTRYVLSIEEPTCPAGGGLAVTYTSGDPRMYLHLSIGPKGEFDLIAPPQATIGAHEASIETATVPGVDGPTAATTIMFVQQGQIVRAGGYYSLTPPVVALLDSIRVMDDDEWQRLVGQRGILVTVER